MIVGTFTGGAAALLGDVWLVQSQDERRFLNNATYEYLKAKQFADLPPGIVLLGAIAMYALPRVQTEQFQLRMAELRAKIASRRKPR